MSEAHPEDMIEVQTRVETVVDDTQYVYLPGQLVPRHVAEQIGIVEPLSPATAGRKPRPKSKSAKGR